VFHEEELCAVIASASDVASAPGFSRERRGPGRVTGALLLLVLLASAGHAQEVPDKGPRYEELPNFQKVNARLYRGGQPRTGGLKRLASLGVKTVINLRDDDARARREGEEAKAAGLHYFNVPFGRLGRPADAEVEHVLALIDAPENGVVFVHCAKGQDRTGTVVAVYRITHDGWTSEQAKQEANRYGMRFWQRGMKDYISDYYRDHAPRTRPGRPR
jgi:protein tyrosine/serine phosphatase